jgi:hypothetical protein
MDNGWTIANLNIVKATADQVIFTYNVGKYVCIWFFTFNPVGVITYAYCSTPPTTPIPGPPPGPFSLDVYGATPAELNTNVILLYARVYNTGDVKILPHFVSRYYSPSYSSEFNGKPGSVSRDAASNAIAYGMGKGWKLDNVRIVRATDTQVIYTYNVGASFATGFVTFNPPGILFSTILANVAIPQ